MCDGVSFRNFLPTVEITLNTVQQISTALTMSGSYMTPNIHLLQNNNYNTITDVLISLQQMYILQLQPVSMYLYHLI